MFLKICLVSINIYNLHCLRCAILLFRKSCIHMIRVLEKRNQKNLCNQMRSFSSTSNFDWVVGIVGLSTMHSSLIHKMEHPSILVEVSLLHRQSKKNPKECCNDVSSMSIDGVVTGGKCISFKTRLCLSRMHIYVPRLGMFNLELCKVTCRK